MTQRGDEANNTLSSSVALASPPPQSPSAPRRAVLSFAIIGVLAAYAYCVASGEYLWPISPHPMYSSIQGRTFTTFALVGVSEQGEFPLRSEHARPIGASTLRAVLNRKQGREHEKALATFQKLYERARVNNPEFPELLGLRSYEQVFQIPKQGRSLATLPKPRSTLTSSLFLAPLPLRQEFKQQAENVAPPVRAAGAGDIVVELHAAEPSSTPKVNDARASEREAFVLSGKARRAPQAEPARYIDVTFHAEAGTYTLWLRGAAAEKKQEASVWVQLDEELGTQRVAPHDKRAQSSGFGNWHTGLPQQVFAWSSCVPGAPPLRVSFATAGSHRLRLSAREGSAWVDQLWLSREQQEAPSFSGAVSAP